MVLKFTCCCCEIAQLCLTLCDLMDCSPPRSSVCGILQEKYWSGLPFPSPGDLSDPGIEPVSVMSPALTCRFFTTSANWEAALELVNTWCLSLPVCEMERC